MAGLPRVRRVVVAAGESVDLQIDQAWSQIRCLRTVVGRDLDDGARDFNAHW